MVYQRGCVGDGEFGPVRFSAGGVEHHETHRIFGGLAHRTEPALVAYSGQQSGQRIVCRVTGGPALVDPVQHKIAAAKLTENRLRGLRNGNPNQGGSLPGRTHSKRPDEYDASHAGGRIGLP